MSSTVTIAGDSLQASRTSPSSIRSRGSRPRCGRTSCTPARTATTASSRRTNLSIHRSYEEDHLPLSRLLNPHAALMTAITGFDERAIIGQALVRRYVLSYEPYHFKGRLEDFPLTTLYGRAMDALRSEWRAWFWDGDYRDEVGATVVDPEGRRHFPYAVYSPSGGGHPGVAVANHGDQPAVLTLSVDGSDEPLALHLVDGPGWIACQPARGGVVIELPARSAGIVLPRRVVEAPRTPAEGVPR